MKAKAMELMMEAIEYYNECLETDPGRAAHEAYCEMEAVYETLYSLDLVTVEEFNAMKKEVLG